MYNLNDVEIGKATRIATGELERAGVRIVRVKIVKPRYVSVRIPIIGLQLFDNGRMVAYVRNEIYWKVRASAKLDPDLAIAVNILFGDVTRVYGEAGGNAVRKDGCAHWHVDTTAGLNALAAVLTHRFGRRSRQPSPDVQRLIDLGVLSDAYGNP
jgi:hypothetical protein